MESVKTNEGDGIIHLSTEERLEPVAAILAVFDQTSVQYLRLDLWKCLKAATCTVGWYQLRQPGDAVVLQRRVEKLLEASWLLLQQKEARDGDVQLPGAAPGSDAWLEEDRLRHLEYCAIEAEFEGSIRCLHQRELNYPALVLKDVFSTLTLREWKRLLSEWTEYALGATSLLQETENYELLLHYEQLERLLEVTYYFTLLLDAGAGDILGVIKEQAASLSELS